MHIRAASLDDTSAIAACFTASVHGLTHADYDAAQRQAWAPQPPDLQAWRDRLSRHHALVAIEGDSVLGFATFTRDGHLDMLYVDPAAARTGVATRLCQQVEQALLQSGCCTLTTEASLTARPFFERHGFGVVARERVERGGVWFDRFAMRKRLPAPTGWSMPQRVALWCWLVPLVGGLGIFVLLVATRWVMLALAGLLDIYLGLAALVAGLLALAIEAWATRGRGSRRLTRRRWLLAVLLVSNLLAGFAVIKLFTWIALRPG